MRQTPWGGGGGIGVGMFDSFRIFIPNSDLVSWRLKKSEEDSMVTLSIMLLGAKSRTLPLERHLGC